MAPARGRRFPTPNAHERIHAATAAVIVRSGYEQASVDEICRIAEVAPEAFSEHFESKQQAVLSAVEAAADWVMGDCRAAVAAAPTWPDGVWSAACVFADCGACEPDFALLALVEMPKAGPQAAELMRSLIDTFCLFLSPGYRLACERALPAGSLDAAIGAEMLALLREHVRSDSPQTLPAIVPALVRGALTPFLGAATAQQFVADRAADLRPSRRR